MTDLTAASTLSVQRVRHPLKSRLVQVKRVEHVQPGFVRVTFGGDELEGFLSASFDDHMKMFFPADPDAKPTKPEAGEKGMVFPEGVERPVARDYTPLHFDAEKLELEVDFVLHEAGPATRWAAQAKPGQYLLIGGPRGSFVIPEAFDWHVLLGDETALPAIRRRLRELPAGKRAMVIIETQHTSGHVTLETQADVHVQWVRPAVDTADGVSALERAVRRLLLPEGDGFIWAAGEYNVVRRIRQYLVEEKHINKSRIRASSYWRQGEQGVHKNFED
ncbi:MAG: siderophore-interacting protein [Pigmentiphaga sp.]|nr:siderophore-interacting protein [Pigmentiphaga sp.]